MSTGTSEARLLAGQRVLVTGGSGGIGRGICDVLAREGAKVAFTYHGNQDGADTTLELVKRHGEGIAIGVDLREREAAPRIVAEVESAWGGVDALVNNA